MYMYIYICRVYYSLELIFVDMTVCMHFHDRGLDPFLIISEYTSLRLKQCASIDMGAILIYG